MKETGKIAGALIGLILMIIIVFVLGITVLGLETLVLWGLGSLAFVLLGIGATITFGRCFGVIIVANLIAWMIRKIFFNDTKITINKD